MKRNPAALVEHLTGCAPTEVAAGCDLEDLRALQLLVDEAIEIQAHGPVLRVVHA